VEIRWREVNACMNSFFFVMATVFHAGQPPNTGTRRSDRTWSTSYQRRAMPRDVGLMLVVADDDLSGLPSTLAAKSSIALRAVTRA